MCSNLGPRDINLDCKYISTVSLCD
jgi:hypothetical protein